MEPISSAASRLLSKASSAPTLLESVKPGPPKEVKPINPALLDNNKYPYEPGYTRFDRYREDEPGIQEWARRGATNSPSQGDGTAPAAPPTILRGGADADRKGEMPDPQWLREYYRRKYLDIRKA